MDDVKILLSALFHDLGKVLERTKEYYTKELPKRFAKVEYAHPKFSAFLLETLGKEKSELSNFLKEHLTEEVIDLVLFHHSPQNDYGQIIQIADWLASSEREENQSQKEHYVNVVLSGPFKKVDENAKDIKYPLTTLENIFPSSGDVKASDESYKRLVNSLLKLFPKVDNIDQLLTLFEFYLSQVPAQTTGYEPDISIYDHSRITAGLAHALYKDYKNNLLNKNDLNKIKDLLRDRKKIDTAGEEIFNRKLFTFIVGDISGIQSFLFNVSSERAGRMLKGKSVFIDLLSRYSAKFILDSTGFTRVNTLYLGGGNFELLLSYIPEDELTRLRNYIIETLWKFVGDDLYLGIEWDYLSINDLLNFINKREEVMLKANQRKKKRYSTLENFYDLIFVPKSEDIKEGEYCTICGKKKVEDASLQDRWCKTCKSFVELTGKLRDASFLIEERVNIPSSKDPETWDEFFEKLGYRIGFVDDFPLLGQISKKIYQLEDVHIKDGFIPDGFLLGSFKIIESNFEDIAKRNIVEDYGDKKLAYLKMDADNMGEIFKKLGDKEKEREGLALTRYGILSRRMELFFGKGVLDLIKDKREKGYLYPVFVGGDDLFIIGTYNEINNLVREIREKYSEYTGSQEIFTISTGMGYFPDNFPLIRGARIVEEFLEKAKNFVYPEEEKPKKNKICVDGEVLSYREYEEALDIANELTKRILGNKEEKQKSEEGKSKGQTSRAVITKIERSIKGFNPLLEQSLNRKISPPAVWRFLYYLRDYKDIGERLVNILLKNLLGEGEKIRNPRLILVATKIARMKTRKLEGGKSK